MRFYILTLLGLVVLIAGVFPFSGLSEKKRTIAVFYPSPYGEYKDLRTEFLAVGSNVMDAQNYPYNRTYNNGEICVQKRITFGRPFNPSPFSGGSGVPAISYDNDNKRLDIDSGVDNDLVFGSEGISMLSQTVEITPYKSVQIGSDQFSNSGMTQEIKIIGEETNIKNKSINITNESINISSPKGTNESINISSPNGTVVIDFHGNYVQMNSFSSPVSIYSTYYVSINAGNSSLTVGGSKVDLNGKLCLNGECIGQWSDLQNIRIVENYCYNTRGMPCTAQCPRGWIRISGGCRCKNRNLEYSYRKNRVATIRRSTTIIENRPTNKNGWACYGRCDGGGMYAYAVCLKTDLN